MPRRKPPSPTLVHRVVALLKRNPWRTISLVVTLFIGIPGIGLSLEYVNRNLEPWYWTSHAYARELVADDHTYIIYLKLRDARQALKDAKADLVKTPDSGTAQRAVEYYVDIIAKYQKQLDKAAGN